MAKNAVTLSTVLGFLEDTNNYTLSVDDHEVEFIDDYGVCTRNEQFFVLGNEFGATHVIHAESYDAAWAAWLDEQPTIDEAELPEAYGVDDLIRDEDHAAGRQSPPWGAPEYAAWWANFQARCVARLHELGSSDNPPDLIEGYEYQSNTTGTGIVNVGDYVWGGEADLSRITIAPKDK